MASHSRGIWILDSLSALQEVTAGATASGAQLFSIRSAEMIRYSQPKAHAGDIAAFNRPGGGAEFVLRLPVPKDAPQVLIES